VDSILVMKKKSYKITFGLKEGYSKNGKLHTRAFAEQVIAKWMSERLKQEYPIVTGLLQQGSLFYPAVGANKKNAIIVSQSAIYSGELSSSEDLARQNREVKNTLESLAIEIKEKLKQESVFVI
jgi:hypothetical protein